GNPAPRNDFEIADLRLGLGAAVGLDVTHHDVDPSPLEEMGVFQHLVGLPDARRVADVELELAPPAPLDELEKRLRGSAGRRTHHVILGTRERAIEVEVRQKHVDPRLAEEAKSPWLDVPAKDRFYLL